jgi:4-amino-4-deoxy-L-arabinose transferase-like glycosyltransferase
LPVRERLPGPAAAETRSTSESLSRIAVFGVLALVFLIRLAHLSSAMVSPLTYQPGPDEDYYRRFGLAVALGQGQDSPEFTFMDPAYGYILGAIFRVLGPNLFVVYLLQVVLDTATAYGILRIGRLLGRPRAGLVGALLYGLTSTAVMFCTTLLKEVWVTAFLTWWVVGALALIRSRRSWSWLLFGLFTGLGVGLRSTLLLLGLAAVLLPLWSDQQAAARKAGNGMRHWAVQAALVICGMVVTLLPWSLRNYQAYGSLSPLPHNGGIILQQIYNDQNPNAEIWVPPFVSYLHPSEIWRGYAAEASRRAGHQLSPPEVDGYWHGEALTFIEDHPGQVLGEVFRKGLGWLSNAELANNRSDVEERMFSPVLAMLPSPAAWLLAMGLAGLAWLAREDRRWPVVAVPIALAWFTMAVFFSESRFRLHATPMLALCSGVWIDQVIRHARSVSKRPTALFVGLAAVIATTSLLLGSRTPPVPVQWDRIAWGYINMGKIPEAQAVAERVSKEQPNNAPIFEALGYTAVAQQHYDDAAHALQHAIELRPGSHVAHYNLARVYLALGDRKRAAEEAGIAVNLNPSPDYQALLNQIEAGS